MKLSRLLPLASLALVVVLSGFGLTGCHTYKYFDITVSFDQATFDDSDIGLIHTCRVFVSGAESTNFPLMRCPNNAAPDPHVIGEFEYSSFVESGTLTFDVKTFTGLNETAACQTGEGMTPIPVTGATTITGNVVIAKTGAGCGNNVTPPTDGGP